MKTIRIFQELNQVAVRRQMDAPFFKDVQSLLPLGRLRVVGDVVRARRASDIHRCAGLAMEGHQREEWVLFPASTKVKISGAYVKAECALYRREGNCSPRAH